MRYKIFCGGFLCKKERKLKHCCDCNILVCEECSFLFANKYIHCIDCFVKNHLPYKDVLLDIDDLPVYLDS